MFPLFELARIFSLPHSPKKKCGHDVKIIRHAWKEVGERYTLSLFLSNGIFHKFFLVHLMSTYGVVYYCLNIYMYST